MNSRRSFIKSTGLVTTGVLFPNLMFPIQGSIFEQMPILKDESFESELDTLLITKEVILGDNNRNINVKGLITLGLISDAFENGNPTKKEKRRLKRSLIELKNSSSEELKLSESSEINPVYPFINPISNTTLTRDARYLSNSAHFYKYAKLGKYVIKKLFKKFAESFAENAGEKVADRIFSEGKELSQKEKNKIQEAYCKEIIDRCKNNKELYELILDSKIHSELGLNSLEVKFEERFNQLKGTLPKEMQEAINKMLSNKKGDAQKYIEKILRENSVKTSNAVVKAILEKEADVEKKKKDWKETQAKVYVGKFIAGQIFDEQTAKEISAVADVGMNIASLVISGSNPWIMAAGFLNGFQTLSSVFGKKRQNPNKAIFDALRNIQKMLKDISTQLTTIQENQKIILEEIIRIGDDIIDKINDESQQIKERLTQIQTRVETSIRTDIAIAQSQEYSKFNSSVQEVDTDIKGLQSNINPSYKDLEQACKVFYHYSRNVSGEFQFVGDSRFWVFENIKNDLKSLERFDLQIAKTPLFINTFSEKNYTIGESRYNANNPYEWARGAIALAETLISFPKLARSKDKRNLRKLNELGILGKKITSDIQSLLTKENIDIVFKKYESTIKSLINNAIQNAIEEVSKKTGLRIEDKEVIDMIYVHKKHLLSEFNKTESISKVIRISEIPEPTINGDFYIKVGKENSGSYLLKTQQNLYMNPKNYTNIGSFFVGKGRNPVFVAEKLGLINLDPVPNPQAPIIIGYPSKIMNTDRGLPSKPLIYPVGSNRTPYRIAWGYGTPFTNKVIQEWVRVRGGGPIGENDDTELRTIRYDWHSNQISNVQYTFNAYRIEFNDTFEGNYKGQPAGSDHHGWTIARLKDLKSGQLSNTVSFWTPRLYDQVWLRPNRPFNSTETVLEVIKEELFNFHDKVKLYLQVEIGKQLLKPNDQFEAISRSLQLLGALSYWNKGGSFVQANKVASDPGYLFSELKKPAKEIQGYKSPTLFDVLSRVLVDIPNEDNSISVISHIKNKMLELVIDNMNRFRKNFFLDDPRNGKGIPEINLAIKMIEETKNQYNLT